MIGGYSAGKCADDDPHSRAQSGSGVGPIIGIIRNAKAGHEAGLCATADRLRLLIRQLAFRALPALSASQCSDFSSWFRTAALRASSIFFLPAGPMVLSRRSQASEKVS